MSCYHSVPGLSPAWNLLFSHISWLSTKSNQKNWVVILFTLTKPCGCGCEPYSCKLGADSLNGTRVLIRNHLQSLNWSQTSWSFTISLNMFRAKHTKICNFTVFSVHSHSPVQTQKVLPFQKTTPLAPLPLSLLTVCSQQVWLHSSFRYTVSCSARRLSSSSSTIFHLYYIPQLLLYWRHTALPIFHISACLFDTSLFEWERGTFSSTSLKQKFSSSRPDNTTSAPT